MTARQSLVLAGHGSQHHPDAAEPLHDHADRIRARAIFDEVRTVFWKEAPALHDARAITTGEDLYAVPVLTSEGYFADEVFPRELDADGLQYTEPVGTHRAMRAVIRDRIESTATGPLEDVGVVLVGHGTERNEQSATATKTHASRLRSTGAFSQVVSLFLDESPHVSELFTRVNAPEVVVVPLFVADGYHTTTDIPAAIDHPGVGETASLSGQVVHLTGAVGTEPRLADVIVERSVEAGASRERGPAGDRSPAAQSFLAIHDAPMEWGELLVTRDDTGYTVRHQNDRGLHGLHSIDSPEALRRRVRRDDSETYRPFLGARSLPTGWHLDGLSRDGLIRSLRAVYPGSITRWYRERQGTLEPTSLEESAARQSGIYADLAATDRPTREAAAAAVCGDCVRQRQWSLHEADDPPCADDDTTIPCREACPFFRSALRAVTESEQATPQSVDTAVPAGDLADPGNRYRVRFAHARSGQRPLTGDAGGGS